MTSEMTSDCLHHQVRGATSKSVSYHKILVAKLATGVHASYPI